MRPAQTCREQRTKQKEHKQRTTIKECSRKGEPYAGVAGGDQFPEVDFRSLHCGQHFHHSQRFAHDLVHKGYFLAAVHSTLLELQLAELGPEYQGLKYRHKIVSQFIDN